MERSSYSVMFAVRESKKQKSGECPIECRITIQGKRVTLNTNKSVEASQWDQKRQRVKGRTETSSTINDFLESFKTKIFKKETELIDNGYHVTADLLRDALQDKVSKLKEYTLIDVFTEHNQQQKAIVGNGISKSTHYFSEYTLRLIREFLKSQFKRDDIYLSELNINFIKEFHIFLLKRMGQNTTTKHTKLLEKIVNVAVANSYMKFNPFLTYKLKFPLQILGSYMSAKFSSTNSSFCGKSPEVNVCHSALNPWQR